MKYFPLVLFILLFFNKAQSQHWDTIKLINPSFEGTPSCCQVPTGWTDCGYKFETPPDIHPAFDVDQKPFFHVTQKPFEGKTYLGMVVREHYTNERIAQKLEKPLLKNHCYAFDIYLCRSDSYLSGVNKNDPMKLVEFTEPVILRIWGGDTICHQKLILTISEPIDNIKWKNYNFQFKTMADFNYFQLEAYYDTKKIFPYNGNLLLDNASDIIEIDCNLIKQN